MILYIALFVLVGIIIYQGISAYMTQKQYQQHIAHLTAEWQQERKDLYNRIQASNYAEYTTGEVKKIKAEKDEPPKFNLL